MRGPLEGEVYVGSERRPVGPVETGGRIVVAFDASLSYPTTLHVATRLVALLEHSIDATYVDDIHLLFMAFLPFPCAVGSFTERGQPIDDVGVPTRYSSTGSSVIRPNSTSPSPDGRPAASVTGSRNVPPLAFS
jgi:hypothetical protein